MKVRCGDVVYLNRVLPMRNHLQGGNRPYVVVSNDMGNLHSELCIIVPLTTAHRKRLLPTHARTIYHNSLCLCEQIFTVPQKDVDNIAFHLPEDDMKKIKRCLKSSCDLW